MNIFNLIYYIRNREPLQFQREGDFYGKNMIHYFKQKFSNTNREWASIMKKIMCKVKLLHGLSNHGDYNEHNNKNEKNHVLAI